MITPVIWGPRQIIKYEAAESNPVMDMYVELGSHGSKLLLLSYTYLHETKFDFECTPGEGYDMYSIKDVY